MCKGLPLRPSNHAITLHFATLFNLRKETLFRGLNIRLCPRTFVTLNLESVSFFGSKNRSHYNVGRAAARITSRSIVYTFKPNKEVPPGAKYYITYLFRWSILPPYQFSFEYFIPYRLVVNRAENEDIISKCGCLSFTRSFRKTGWKVNETRFLGSFRWKFSESNILTSEKVEPFFPVGVRVPFLQTTFDTMFRPSRSFSGKRN